MKTTFPSAVSIVKLLMLSLLLMMPFFASAQGRHLTGKVVDSQTGSAMPYVNVALMRPADTVFLRGATTDFDGLFDIRDVDTGSFLLQASCVGYTNLFQIVNVAPDAASLIELGTLSMSPGTMLQSVKVTAAKPLYAMDGEKNNYNTAEDPSVQTGTASDALQNAPGVEVDAEGNITLRGVSSVEIWINDQPSHMNEEALKQYIKMLPANAIERIEVITNPSARYSTSGGVINIVTSQKVTRNELLCFGANFSTLPNVSPWMSYVWANEKIDFNLYLSGGYSRFKNSGEFNSTMFDGNGDTARVMDGHSKGEGKSIHSYFGGNLNWKIDSVTTLSVWGGVYPGLNRNWTNDSNRYVEYLPTPIDFSYTAETRDTGFYYGGYAGMWFQHQFDTNGRKINASLNGSFFANDSKNYNRRIYNNYPSLNYDRRCLDDGIDPSFNADVNYVLPLKHQWDIELGAEVAYSSEAPSNISDTLDFASGLYVREAIRTYDGDFSYWLPAAYTTVTKRWGNFTAKAGLRAEGRFLNGTYDDDDTYRVKKSYPYLVPSIHLSYRTENFHNFSFSYTRRASAPSGNQLCTYKLYGNESFSTGNPALRMSYAHNLEGAWNKYFMKFGSIGLKAYYHANTDQISGLTDVIYESYYGRLVSYSTYANLGSSHTEGLEANVTFRPTAMLNVRFDASLFNNGYSTLFRDKPMNDHLVGYSFRLNVWTKLWNWLQVFANANYSSASLDFFEETLPHKGVDLGMSTDLLDRRLSLYVHVSDVFNMQEWGSSNRNPYLQSTDKSRWSSRFLSFGVNWRIGKMELEGRARQGASESPTGAPGQ